MGEGRAGAHRGRTGTTLWLRGAAGLRFGLSARVCGERRVLGGNFDSRKQGDASVVFTGKYSYTVYEGRGVLCDHVVPGAERCMFVDSHLCGKEIKRRCVC